jgi:hypothetical protein
LGGNISSISLVEEAMLAFTGHGSFLFLEEEALLQA